jgi:membrane protease YdiL (CAAX protease family)
MRTRRARRRPLETLEREWVPDSILLSIQIDSNREAPLEPDIDPGERRASARRTPRSPAPARLVGLAFVFYGILWAIAWGWREGLQGEALWLAAPDAEIHWLRDGALGLLAAAGVIVASSWLTRRVPAGERLARALAETIGPLRTEQAWLLALASGVGEEAFFRGALQPVVGLAWASLLFAAAHFVPRREMLLWSGFSLAAGLLLGGLYEATGNLLAPTVAHVVINGVNLNRLVRDYGPRSAAARD